VDVTLNRPQSAVIRRLKPRTTLCLKFGRGCGKTWFQRFIWYYLVSQWDGKERDGRPGLRGIRIVLLMPTFKQATDNYASLVQAELDGPWAFLGGKVNKTKWRIEFPGGSWIQFFGAENADSARGIRCDVVSIDECDDVDPGVFDAIVQPWFSEPWSLGIKVATGTPRRGRYGLLYKLWRLGQDGVEGFASFHATYRDVPEIVSREYVEQVRQTTTRELFAREWEADEDAAEGLVYSVFREAFHVRVPNPQIRWTEILVGADFGWEDPGVFLVAGVQGSGRDATVHLLEEVYRQHQPNGWWNEEARRIVKAYPGARWYADPSRPDRAADLRSCGCRMQDTDNSIEAGVGAIADRLIVRTHGGKPCESCDGLGCSVCAKAPTVWARLYISPECTNTIAEFGLYRRKRDPRNKERVLDDIEDKNNHAMDALRYAIFSRFGGPSRTRSESGAGW
jgi:hypothetical protein